MGSDAINNSSAKASEFSARDYQIELLEKAIERNLIVCMGTGTGKTFVSVLLIKHLLYQTLPDGGNKRTVFLAPTVPLVKQQAEVIKTHIETKIGCYYGGEAVDSWQGDQWRHEIEENNVLVMVPQLLSNILNQRYISLEEINLLIFDECHAATGNHCYVQVMENHYVKTALGKQPRILGLTASVLNKKVKPDQVETQIKNLCLKLDSTLATSMTATDFGTKPNEVVVQYRGNPDISKFANAASPKLGTFGSQMNGLLTDVGPYGALKSLEHRRKCTQHLLDVGLAENHRMSELKKLQLEIDSASASVELEFNKIRNKSIPNPYKVLRPNTAGAEAIVDELEVSVPPKVERLIEILETFKKSDRDLCCVIFAQERYTVFALWCLLTALSRKHPARFGFLRPGFVMGAQNSSFKTEEKKIMDFADERFADEGSTLDNFRTGTLNVLVATSVIEEGVDIPQCNLIVKMSDVMNLKSYVQCRGRARAKPSIYAILTSEENKSQVEEEIGNFKLEEEIIKRYCKKHDMDIMDSSEVELALASDPDLPTMYANPDDPSSAIITAQSARSVLQWYCDTLGNDRYQVMRPQYSYELRPSVTVGNEDKMCRITLPKASKLFPEEVSGKWLANKTKARISAALKTCKRLHDLDELTENLVPRKRPKPNTYVWTDAQVSDEVKELFEGNTIQQKSSIVSNRAMSRELQPMARPVLPARATVYVFRIRLEVPLNDEHSHMRTFRPEDEELCFGLLTFVPDCAANTPDFPIYTRNGTEVVQIDVLGDVTITEELWLLCSKFHTYIMKKVCQICDSEFDLSLAPVYVPVRSNTIDIDLLNKVSSERKRSFGMDSVVTYKIPKKGEDRSFFIRDIFQTAEGCKLSLEKVPKNLDYSRCAFKEKTKFRELSSEERRAVFAVSIIACEAEALTAPQWSKARTIPTCTHRLNRLLIAEQYRQDMMRAGIGHNPQQRWPPMVEDCHPGVRNAQPKVTSAELKFIKEVENSPGPSPTDILTALTPLSAQDIVNSERFEVLGDAFLKIAITLHLFPQKGMSDEGVLTAERCRLNSNMNLLSLAVPKRFHEAVETRKFAINESFRPPGAIYANQEEARKLQRQKYKSKICADSVEAMIGVYLERSGPIGALEFLRYLGLQLGNTEPGPFLSRFDLSYDPVVKQSQASAEDALSKHSWQMNCVENILGYKFNNRLYLLEAITHQSYRYNRVTRSYERLEFLGDAVIDYLVSCFIFTNNPHLDPGQMTSVRSALVCNNQFAQITTKKKLAKYLLHHSPLLFRVTASYTEVIERGQSPETLIGEDETEKTDLIDVPKPYGDLMESLIGAIFIDSGLSFARSWDVFRGLITDEVLVETLNHNPRNPVQVLEERFPTKCRYGPVTIKDDKQIEMSLDIGDLHFSTISRNKKIAKQTLAKIALRAFSKDADVVDTLLSVNERIAQQLNLG